MFRTSFNCMDPFLRVSSSKQVELYDETFRSLVDSVLAGFNGTIFAYGQTGTGKTYTMEGECYYHRMQAETRSNTSTAQSHSMFGLIM